MSKKKEKIQIINNIEKLNLEIDYDKLADSIAKAQITAKKETQFAEKVGFWKSVGKTILNKEKMNGNRTAILLAKIMSTFFNFIAVLGVVFAIATIVVTIQKLNWSIAIWPFVTQFLIVAAAVIVMLSISLIFRAIANEIMAEKDRIYIATLFFGLTSLASLIVALVALFKGVG